MSDVKTLSDEQFDTLIDRFLAVRWPVTRAEADRLLGEWSWSVRRRPEDGIIADTGFGFDVREPCRIGFADSDGDLLDLTIRLSDSGKLNPGAVRDSFTRHVATLRARLGAPAKRKSGDRPHAVWYLSSKARVVLLASQFGEQIEVSSPEWVQVLNMLPDDES